ncbi:MAG: DUF222 domain-containing protein [bacterium]|nr:DUF222 domain-containing protein [bacterium]
MEIRSASEVSGLVAALASMEPAGGQEEAAARIRALEELKAACGAAQARESVRLYELRERAEADAGVPASKRCKGLGSEIALARRESPTRGGRYLGLARALVKELPHTMAAMEAGELSEWRATLVARETAWLSVENRRAVDAELADRMTRLSDKRLAAEARALAQSLDAAGAVENMRRKEKERCVTLRPAPDAMAYLTALLPMREAVAVYATLARDAQSAINGAGSGPAEPGEVGAGEVWEVRTRPQIMADLLVQRITGASSARDLPVELSLVMTDSALFGADETPAHFPGHGPVPAEIARLLLRPESTESVWLRRLYTRPGSGELVAMDSRRRVFDGNLRKLITLRDDVCRTPYCGAPIRHVDHGTAVRDGGETSFANGSGLCERCNYVKEVAGWHYESGPASLSVRSPSGMGADAPPPLLLPGVQRGSPPGMQRGSPSGIHAGGPGGSGIPQAAPMRPGRVRGPRDYARRRHGITPILRSSWCAIKSGQNEVRRLQDAMARRGWRPGDRGGGRHGGGRAGGGESGDSGSGPSHPGH